MFHEIPTIGYIVMAEDSQNYGNLGYQIAITPL